MALLEGADAPVLDRRGRRPQGRAREGDHEEVASGSERGSQRVLLVHRQHLADSIPARVDFDAFSKEGADVEASLDS